MDNSIGGFPGEYCWFLNDQMEYGSWPGPSKTSTPTPLARTRPTTTSRPPTSERSLGYILTLIQYGVTGLVEPPDPVWTPPPLDPDVTQPANWPIGAMVIDGTTIWQICDPKAQGFRFTPRPPSGGNVWLCRLFVQRKARPRFVNLQEYLDPIPDDYSQWFVDGFIAYAHRYATNPAVLSRFDRNRQIWLEGMGAAAKQGDREDEAHGFFPDRPIASPTFVQDQGPYPYRWQGGWG